MWLIILLRNTGFIVGACSVLAANLYPETGEVTDVAAKVRHVHIRSSLGVGIRDDRTVWVADQRGLGWIQLNK